MSKGFVTDDGYAAVPWGKKYIIIYNGRQLVDVSTIKQAYKFIASHRTQPQSGTIFV